ncbi:hypothetical protein QYM36_005983 [Artemia franciscana]|uniref:C2 domain-containing protein n=1 Tax=Artemia franciscana TaxID=6661 RepID=A0AA88L6I5_ARTSF|nr:hypothetical protein QYM36_005983 [Artemia franciscana]
MSCNGKACHTEETKNGMCPTWNKIIILREDDNIHAKFRLKRRKKMLGLIERGLEIGNGEITIGKINLTKQDFEIDMRQSKHVSSTLVAKLHIRVERLDIVTETPKNDNLSLSSYGSPTILGKLKSNKQKKDKIFMEDIEEEAQDKVEVLQKDEEEKFPS